jgi:uncharacterized protein (TIRG00374 family)
VRAFLTRALGLALGLVVGLGLLSLALKGVNLAAVSAALVGGRWTWPALVVLSGTLVFVLAKAARWRLLLGEPPAVSVAALVRSTTAGLALNALVPHAGEFVRAVSLNRRCGLSGSGVLASIVAERVFDLFAVLLLAAVAVERTPVPASVAGAVRVLGLVAMAGAVVIIAVLILPQQFRALAVLLTRLLPARFRGWVLQEVDAALAGFSPVRSWRRSLRVLGWSLIQWLAIAVCAYGACTVVGATVSLGSALFVVVGIVVAFLLPNAPGYAGSAQVAFVVSLSPSGVPSTLAVAASVVYQLLMILPVVVLGLAWLRGCLTPVRPPTASGP